MLAQQTQNHSPSPIALDSHPCFNHAARLTHARIHLPVAPRCNMQCKYCNRKFDCVNESRPGVTCMVMSPGEALMFLNEVARTTKNLSVVGIAGPGDPFANPDETLETLRLVRLHHRNVLLCLATNGLNLLPYIPALAKLNVSHVTLTINAVEPTIGSKIYTWISDGETRRGGIEAARLLWERQKRSLVTLLSYGIVVKVNTIVIPGINDQHVIEVAETVARLGASVFNLMPLYPVAETPFASLSEPSRAQMNGMRAQAARFLPQMTHCMRCRADAVGLLSESACGAKLQKIKRDAEAVRHRMGSRGELGLAS